MVDKSPHPKGCWLWTGSGQRYGKMKIRGVNYSTHRLGYAIQKGVIHDGLMVCHTCDTQRCLRGDHLFLGTGTDNQQDMLRKGRQNRATGDKHGLREHPERAVRGMGFAHAVFTDDDIRAVRALAAAGVLQREIARRFNTRQNHVSKIVRREIWSHVT